MNLVELIPNDVLLYAVPAWASAVTFAIGEASVVAKFRKETGHTWAPSKNPLDVAIDKATGAEEAFMKAFVLWFNENIWGDWSGDAPEEPAAEEVDG